MPEGQKGAPDFIADGCEPPCGCWELNSGPLEEQAMLLTAEPSLQPQNKSFLKDVFLLFFFIMEGGHVHERASTYGGQRH